MSPARGVPPSLAGTLPPDIAAAARAIDSLDDLVEAARRLAIELPGALEGAIEKRRREYLAGRIAARLALGELLGERALRGGLGADQDDVPSWPEGVVGSISHGAGIGFAAVAAANRYLGLGVDVERIVSARQAARLGPRVLTDREQELRHGRNGSLTEEEMFTLAFSAKESAYKALFPFHRRVLGFSDVELECRHGAPGADRSGGLRLQASVDRDADRTATLVGWYACTGGSGGPHGSAIRRMWTLVLTGTDPTASRLSGCAASARPARNRAERPGESSRSARRRLRGPGTARGLPRRRRRW